MWTDWKSAIGDRQMIGVVFLDLKRAFEVVDKAERSNKETPTLWFEGRGIGVVQMLSGE